MKKKNILILISIIVLIGLIGGGLYKYNEKHKLDAAANNKILAAEKEQLEPINTLVKTLYFKQGTYKDYIVVFKNPNNALNEKAFDSYRNNHTAADIFKYDPSTADSIMKHMKVVQDFKNKNTAKVYYLKDIKKLEDNKNSQSWQVVKIGDKWKINN
ncbi:hypothetical protein [Clostridium sp. JS66]|uniref:hypothetical protein n=1 Tax=Clostridium sp. JS66 TaxID=3064705 RepID=UPI00298DDA85|nr:hypothetical protein [Clostridium sp. JS66]WPC42243.1 hypothetical protein Q6H37_01835 [Clostridium sp. JS66]